MSETNTAPSPWMAYAPAFPCGSPLAQYVRISPCAMLGNSGSVVAHTTVGAAALTTHRPVYTWCRRPESRLNMRMQSDSECGFSRMAPSTCTVVSAASTGRSVCRARTASALSRARRMTYSAPASCRAGVSSMSAGVTTWGTPINSNNWRRRGDADASRSTGCSSLFLSIHPPGRDSLPVVRVILQHRVRAIQLFGEDHAHHGVREGQRRQRPAQAGLDQDPRTQAFRPADHEGEVAAVLLAFGQP